MRILLVEDNVGDARLVIEASKECSVPTNVIVVGDGLQALAYLRRQGQHANATLPDLVLLDLNLPKMDGRDVLVAIKADHALRHIPVVIFTSSAADHEVLLAYRHGASCYLIKPLELTNYFAVLHELVTFWGTRARLPVG
jgi:two-component system, chemotaxis family, response regulator Rcp1